MIIYEVIILKLNNLIFIIILIGIFISVSAVCAADSNNTDVQSADDYDEGTPLTSNSNSIYVDCNGGDDENDGKSWNSSVKTFKKAYGLAKDDDTIYLSDGNYVGLENSRITIDKSINVIGSSNTCFDGEYGNYFFIILDNVHVTFKNIQFINANKDIPDIELIDDYDEEGVYGAVFDIKKATVTIDNCYFKDSIVLAGAASDQFSYGGVISSFGDVTILNSYFYRNSVGFAMDYYGYGGTIYNKGKMFINNTSIIESSGSSYCYGGAIYNDNELTMNNSIIANSYCWEESKGAAIFNNGKFTLLNSIIENNTIQRTDFNYMYGNIFNSGTFIAVGNIFRNNTANYKQPNSEYYGTPTIYNVGSLDLSYNAFIDNVGYKGINTDVYLTGGESINLDNNWWSTNANPFDRNKINFDVVKSWIVLDLNPSYASIKVNESVNVIASWKLSNGEMSQINLLPIFNITLSTVIDGNEIISVQSLAETCNFTFSNIQNRGVYELTASVNSFTTKALIEVGKSNSYLSFDLSNDTIYFNDSIAADIHLIDEDSNGITGEVLVYLNNTRYTVNVVDGRGNISISGYPGDYILKFIYDGTDVYSKSNNETRVYIKKLPTTLKIDDVGDLKTSDTLNLTVTLTGGDIQGIGYLYINGEFKRTVYLNNGNNSFYFSNFAQGQYNITIMLPENSYYLASNATVLFNVDMAHAKLNVSCDDILMGENAYVIVETNSENFNSEAILCLNGTNHTIFLKGKVNNITISNLAKGHYDVQVIFEGNSRFTKANASTSFEVIRYQTSLNVTIIKNDDLTGTITVETNHTKSTGPVDLYVNRRYYSANLKNGQISFKVEFDKGTNYIYVDYYGDKAHEGSSYNTTIGHGENFFIIASNITQYEHNDFNYTIQLFEENGMAVPGVNVSIEFNGTVYNVTTDSQGRAYFALNLNPGNYTIESTYKNGKISNNIAIKPIDFDLVVQNITYLENETIEVVFEQNITGKISIKLNNKIVLLDISGNKVAYDVSGLDAGDYDVEAFYTNDQFKSSAKTAKFKVGKANVTLNVTVPYVSYGEDVIITVNDLDGLDGKIKFIVDGNEHVKDIEGSSVSLKLVDLSMDKHKLDVIYSGDANHNGANLTTYFSFRTLKTDVILNISDADYGRNLVATAKVDPNAGGNIIFKVGNLTYTARITQGLATWTFTGVDVGDYVIEAYYGGDENFVNASNSTGFKVNRANSSIRLYTNEVYLEENIRIYADLSVNATGTVTFSMDDYYSPRQKPVSDASSNWYISPLGSGNYTVRATYSGDKNYYSSNTTFILRVVKHKSNLVVEINDAGKNDNVIIRARLNYDNGKPIDGRVYVTIGTKSYRVNVYDGTGVLNIGKLSFGDYSFTAFYDGSEDYGPSTAQGSFKVVDNLLDVVLYCNNVTKYYKGDEKLVVYLYTTSNKAISGATIHVKLNGVISDYVTDDYGKVAVDLNFAKGTYNAQITFDETKTYHASSCSAVVKILPTVEGSDLVKLAGSGTQYFATFHDKNGNALANTDVKFTISGKTYTFKTLPNGVARININLAPGKYSITATNPVTGEKATNTITIYLKIMENKDLTMYFGAGKSYKVRAYGDNGKPVGAGKVVTFKINGKSYNVKTDKNGYASLKVNLKAGTYSITASYGGYKVSNKIVVKPVLTASNVAYKKATSYKFSAKLVDTNGKALKSKKITFKIKGKTYYGTTNANGIATITIKLSLNVGKYSITSTYGKSTITNTLTIKK